MGAAVVPLNVTVLVPCVEPKLVPVIFTPEPTGPPIREMLLIFGDAVAEVTVKRAPLLIAPPTATTTFPVVAPAGTGRTMEVALQLAGAAVVPLKATALAPCVTPKFVPVTVTEVPTGPDTGDRLEMLGTGPVTVNRTPLLPRPATITRTFPVVTPFGTGAIIDVALQLVGVAATPLNVNVLVP